MDEQIAKILNAILEEMKKQSKSLATLAEVEEARMEKIIEVNSQLENMEQKMNELKDDPFGINFKKMG